jgi:hypothetical protein
MDEVEIRFRIFKHLVFTHNWEAAKAGIFAHDTCNIKDKCPDCNIILEKVDEN